MTPEQFKNFKKVIKHESDKAMKSFIIAEIEATPEDAERVEFLDGIDNSVFFSDFFMRGFIEGITFQQNNKDTKYLC